MPIFFSPAELKRSQKRLSIRFKLYFVLLVQSSRMCPTTVWLECCTYAGFHTGFFWRLRHVGDFGVVSHINHTFRDYRVRADKLSRIYTGFCVGGGEGDMSGRRW